MERHLDVPTSESAGIKFRHLLLAYFCAAIIAGPQVAGEALGSMVRGDVYSPLILLVCFPVGLTFGLLRGSALPHIVLSVGGVGFLIYSLVAVVACVTQKRWIVWLFAAMLLLNVAGCHILQR